MSPRHGSSEDQTRGTRQVGAPTSVVWLLCENRKKWGEDQGLKLEKEQPTV